MINEEEEKSVEEEDGEEEDGREEVTLTKAEMKALSHIKKLDEFCQVN